MATGKNETATTGAIPANSILAVTRIFDAPRELVWKAWTEPERLAQWWGPKGFKWKHSKMDFRPDGIFHYCMVSPDGHEMWGKFVYREIAAPKRLVFTNSFSDEEGNTVRAPFSQDWPLEILNTFTFTEQGGKTTIEMHGIPVNATDKEQKAFDAAQQSIQQGFKGTFDQLDEYLVNAVKGKSA